MKYKNIKQIHYKNEYNYFIANKKRSQLWRSRQKTKERRRERLKLEKILSNTDTKDTAPDEPQDKDRDKNRVQDNSQENIKAKTQGETRDGIQNKFRFKSSTIGETSSTSTNIRPSTSAQHVEVIFIRNL